ncbi:MAG: M48 family metallopeptidase [Ruminococcus sp.]|nr:M48 family metallopeptidase [Ruminococcus sp.]
MKILSTETRKVQTRCGEIEFVFERKNIKNINLRIRHDGNIYVSAPEKVSEKTADSFVISRCRYIKNAVEGFKRNNIPKYEMQYISGENVTFLGKNMRLKIEKDSHEYINCDGVYVYIHVKRPDYYNRKKNLLNNWLDEQCINVFSEIMQAVHRKFIPYGVEYPQLKIRNMSSRWGSCLSDRGIVTLNKRLIEAPKNCIEYVVYHEFCHFVHPNHSKNFYSLLQVMLPDWRESKKILESTLIIN